MSLKLRATPAVQRPTAGRRLTVVTKAISLQDLSNAFANGFVRIFSKPQSNVDTFAENNFSGKISHHGARKPFADGYSAVKPTKLAPAEPTAERTDQEAEDYLKGAVGRVVAHNFTGDSTEPKSFGLNDFSGQIHTGRKDREGFHSKTK